MNKNRAIAGVVVNLPEPAISNGQPSLPVHWSRFQAVATLKQGPLHIHAIADPNPVWDPRTGGWYTPPPPVAKPKPVAGAPATSTSGAGDYRWTVDTLPDPSGSYYWLGDASSRDGTAGISASRQSWGTAPGGPVGPAWRSFYPYKPSVAAYDHYIPGEGTVHHAKGVHCNSHYVEHMWLDWGRTMLQPFTWIVVATRMHDSFPGYTHNILGAGRNPDSVGFPRLSSGAVSQSRRINDGLAYNTRLVTIANNASISTGGPSGIAVPTSSGHNPKMYVGIFNGRSSTVGVFDPFARNLGRGAVRNGAGFSHRYTVLGREAGWISQSHASNILLFEMRYWHHALTGDDLTEQYKQLSATHQFDRYKRL